MEEDITDEATEGAAGGPVTSPASKTATPEERSAAARLMGSARSAAKAASSKANGAKGGRPKGYHLSEEAKRRIGEANRAAAARRAQESGGAS